MPEIYASAQWNFGNNPEINMPLYLKNAEQLEIRIKDAEDNVMFTDKLSAKKGLNYVKYPLLSSLEAGTNEKI